MGERGIKWQPGTIQQHKRDQVRVYGMEDIFTGILEILHTHIRYTTLL